MQDGLRHPNSPSRYGNSGGGGGVGRARTAAASSYHRRDPARAGGTDGYSTGPYPAYDGARHQRHRPVTQQQQQQQQQQQRQPNDRRSTIAGGVGAPARRGRGIGGFSTGIPPPRVFQFAMQDTERIDRKHSINRVPIDTMPILDVRALACCEPFALPGGAASRRESYKPQTQVHLLRVSAY